MENLKKKISDRDMRDLILGHLAGAEIPNHFPGMTREDVADEMRAYLKARFAELGLNLMDLTSG